MADYACFCTGCNTFQFTPWGIRICPSCNGVLIQSRVNRAAFESLPVRQKYITFLPLVKEGSPEAELLKAGMESHEEVRKLQQKRDEEVRKLQQKRDEEVLQKELLKKEMLMSAGFSPEGFSVIRNCGSVFSDRSLLIPAYTALLSEAQGRRPLSDITASLRSQALDELMDKAVDLGCNALTGLEINYLTLPLQEYYEVCVSVMGNAVFIEKTGCTETAADDEGDDMERTAKDPDKQF